MERGCPSLDRRAFLAAAFAAVPFAGDAAAQDMIEEPWSAGGLAGTFTRPRGGPPRGPAALIVAGSGPTPRDGNFGTYRQIAHSLAAAGIRSLRYDKRGVGGSRALVTREDDIVFSLFVDDAVVAARDLAARPDVSAVLIAGHSEGALIATLAAAKIEVAGIALLAGPGRRLDVVLREQLLATPLPPEQEHYRQEALETLARLSRGERVDNIPPEQAALFRPSVQPFLLSLFPIDPAVELAKSTLPVLLVRGESDIQVSVADLDALAKAQPDARVVSLPATNHVFKPAPVDIADRPGQLASYNAAAPLVPGLVPALTDFVQSATR